MKKSGRTMGLIEKVIFDYGIWLINLKIPGNDYKIDPNDEEEISISKAVIISIFKEIILETDGFTTAICVQFKHRNATKIGMVLGHILSYSCNFMINPNDEYSLPDLDSQLTRINESGSLVPEFFSNVGIGPEFPNIRFSNFTRSIGVKGSNLNGVKIVDIDDSDLLPVKTYKLCDFY